MKKLTKVHLDATCESMLDLLRNAKSLSKSAIIKEALILYFRKEKKFLSPYEQRTFLGRKEAIQMLLPSIKVV